MEQWAAEKVEKRKVVDLIPYDRNPRLHSDTQIENLANAIKEWGWTSPILIDEESNVIAGHGRLFAAQKLQIEDVPCIIAKGWTDNQKKAYVIADNKLAEGSSWDFSLYYEQLQKIDKDGFDLSLIGIDDDLEFNFKPITEPDFSFGGVTDADIQKRQEEINSNFDTSGAESEKNFETVCPSCGHTFKFSGL